MLLLLPLAVATGAATARTSCWFRRLAPVARALRCSWHGAAAWGACCREGATAHGRALGGEHSEAAMLRKGDGLNCRNRGCRWEGRQGREISG